MSEIKEPLWGELDEAPASMERRPPLFLFRNHFDHCSKDQDGGLKHGISSKKESELTKRTDKGKRKRSESHTSLAPPKKRREPFNEIGNSLLGLESQQTYLTGSASLERLPVRLKQGTGNGSCLSREIEIDEIDLPDLNNVQSGVQYVKDLYIFYNEQQHVCRPIDYMPNQFRINADMRESSVQWLIVLCHELHLQTETLYLAVSIVDCFLSLHQVTARQLRLVGISSLLIATKYEEDWVPQVYKFLNISGGQYTGREVCFWEKIVLDKLEWYLTIPTVFTFLVRYAKAAKADKELEHMIFFYGELGLMQYNLILYRPSMVAASTVYAARCTLKKSPFWTDALKRHTSYSESQLVDCARVVVQAHLATPNSKRKMQVIFKKYMHTDYGAVARSPPASILIT